MCLKCNRMVTDTLHGMQRYGMKLGMRTEGKYLAR